MNIKVKTQTALLFSIIILLICLTLGLSLKMDAFYIFPILIASVLLLIKYRNTILGLPCFLILWANYSIIAYFWANLFGHSDSYSYTYFYSFPDTLSRALLIMYIFTGVLFCVAYFLPNVKKKQKVNFACRKSEKNLPFSYGFVILLFIVLLYFVVRRINSGVYEESSIFEYMSIIFILAFYFSGDSKPIKYFLLLLTLLYCVFVFYNGDRGSAIQFLLIAFYFCLYDRINNLPLYLALFIGVVFLTIIGDWRNNYVLSFSSSLNSFRSFFDKGLTLDTAFASEACGVAIIQMRGDYSGLERLLLLGKYVFSIFVGGSIVGKEANLASMARDFSPYHGGGGMLFNYGYFYLGFIGIVLLALYVGYFYRKTAKLNNESSGIEKCVSLFLVCTTSRWYLYSPAPLFRGLLLLCLLFMFVKLFEKKSESIYSYAR